MTGKENKFTSLEDHLRHKENSKDGETCILCKLREDIRDLFIQRNDLLSVCEAALPYIARGIADGAFNVCDAPNGAMLTLAKMLATINKVKGE